MVMQLWFKGRVARWAVGSISSRFGSPRSLGGGQTTALPKRLEIEPRWAGAVTAKKMFTHLGESGDAQPLAYRVAVKVSFGAGFKERKSHHHVETGGGDRKWYLDL